MGMFDEVILRCPYCNKSTVTQSKAGECVLGIFSLNDDVRIDMDMIGEHWCDHCSKKFHVVVEQRPKFTAVTAEDYQENYVAKD